MTAFQAGQIVQEYIRGALPLFEPMEQERNGGVCEETFEVLYATAPSAPVDSMPQAAAQRRHRLPLREPAARRDRAQKGTKFLEFKQIVAEAIALDPTVAHIPDAKVILRDVANGIRVPAKWLRTESRCARPRRLRPQPRQQQQLLANLRSRAPRWRRTSARRARTRRKPRRPGLMRPSLNPSVKDPTFSDEARLR
jgi:hypothetical protein